MPYALPSQHRFAHDYSIFLHDRTVSLLKSAEHYRVLQVTTKVTKEEGRAMRGLEGEPLYEWLELHRGPEFTAEMDYRALLGALIADFCHFVLEGLRASAKGKLTVAYALFRKPFKDNLLCLEWLLADRGAFMSLFRHHSPDGINLSALTPTQRLAFITAAAARAGSKGLDPSFIAALRYDRNVPYGLAVPWDQAIHLVTTWRQARTSPQNLNFVFSGIDQWHSQWHHLYSIVPYLMYHTNLIVEALIATVATLDMDETEWHCLRRDLGFTHLAAPLATGDTALSSTQARRDLEESQLKCPKCRQRFRFHDRNIRSFVLRGHLRCSHCRSTCDLTAVRLRRRRRSTAARL